MASSRMKMRMREQTPYVCCCCCSAAGKEGRALVVVTTGTVLAKPIGLWRNPSGDSAGGGRGCEVGGASGGVGVVGSV